jgi:fucose permease
MKGRRLFSLSALLLTLSSFAISVNAVPPLVTTIAGEIGSPIESFGYLFSLQFFLFAAASFTAGWMGERWSLHPRFFVLAGLIIIVTNFFLAVFIDSFTGFILWIIPMGIAGGLVEPSSSVLITDYHTVNSAKLLNLSQVFYCLGAVAAPQLVSVFLRTKLGRNEIFIFFAFFIGLLTLLYFLSTLADPQVKRRVVHGSGPTLRRLRLSAGIFAGASVFLFLYVAIEGVMVSWIAAYFETTIGVSAADAAWRLAVFWAGLLAGRLLIVILPHRLGLGLPVVIGSAGMIAGIAVIAFIRTETAATAALALTGLFCGPVWPSLIGYCRYSGASDKFVTMIIGMGALGLAVSPFLSAVVIDRAGFRLLFILLTCLSALQLITGAWVVRKLASAPPS